jgi:hypothetical protein
VGYFEARFASAFLAAGDKAGFAAALVAGLAALEDLDATDFLVVLLMTREDVFEIVGLAVVVLEVVELVVATIVLL